MQNKNIGEKNKISRDVKVISKAGLALVVVISLIAIGTGISIAASTAQNTEKQQFKIIGGEKYLITKSADKEETSYKSVNGNIYTKEQLKTLDSKVENNLVNTKNNVNVTVIIALKDQPSQGVSPKIKSKYRNAFYNISKSTNKLSINNIKYFESEIRKMRRDIFNQTTPAVNAIQKPVIEKIRSNGGEIKHSSKIFNAIIADIPASYISQLSTDPGIAKIYGDKRMNATLDVSAQSIGAGRWWDNGYTGSPWDVTVVDTGIDATHPALSVDYAKVFHEAAILDTWYGDDYLSTDDLQGHGTHIAGVVTGTDTTFEGVAYGADKLTNAKAGWRSIDGEGSMYVSDAMRAIDWAIFGNEDITDVISFSFGGGPGDGNDLFELYMDSVVSALDIPVVVSAGNSGPGPFTISAPSSAYNVFSVGSVTDSGTPDRSDDSLELYSSRGPTLDGRIKPDILAAGTNIMSANSEWESFDSYVEMSGTSMAAPHITGSILLLLSYNYYGVEALKALLLNTAEDKGVVGPDYDNGFGYANLSDAELHKSDILTGTIDDLPEGSVEKYFKGFLPEGKTATLVWNRHVNYVDMPTGDLSDLDLMIYDENTGTRTGNSGSSINNVEQVKGSGDGSSPVILKIEPYGVFPSSIITEDYALATGGVFTQVNPPMFDIKMSHLGTVIGGNLFNINITINNTGGTTAHDVNVNVELPIGSVNYFAGDMPAGSSNTTTLSVNAPDVNYKTTYAITASASSNSYGDIFSGVNASSIIVKPGQTITITSPNGGEKWMRGTTRTITWASAGSPVPYIKIELLKGGTVNSIISSSTPNDGSHNWFIPSTQILGADYKIRVTGTSNSAYTDTSNNNFTISTSSINVTSPNGGENWQAGIKQTIRWNYSGSPGTYIKIELLKGGVFNRIITSNTSTSRGYYNWTISSTQTPGTNYKVKVTSLTNSVYNDSSDADFTISAAPRPSINVTSPNGGETWARGTKQTIRWNYTGSPGSYVKIELLKKGVLSHTITSNTSTSRGYYNWTIPSTQATGADYKVKITSRTNSAYNDTSNNNFTISG